MTTPRVLIAGIGNVFLGDDAFGVRVLRELEAHPLPADVRRQDFGIRGYDLAVELLRGYERVILVDAARGGGPPGTLYTIDPTADAEAPAEVAEPHGLAPAKVLRLARELGARWGDVRVVGCEPASFEPDPDGRLTPAVEAAVAPAVRLICGLAEGGPAAEAGHA